MYKDKITLGQQSNANTNFNPKPKPPPSHPHLPVEKPPQPPQPSSCAGISESKKQPPVNNNTNTAKNDIVSVDSVAAKIGSVHPSRLAALNPNGEASNDSLPRGGKGALEKRAKNRIRNKKIKSLIGKWANIQKEL